MPGADKDLDGVASDLVYYREATGNAIEVHYTLFDGNDDLGTAERLGTLLKAHDFPIKFLRFSERPDHVLVNSDKQQAFIDRIREMGITAEEYDSPGRDVNGCCGSFEVEN